MTLYLGCPMWGLKLWLGNFFPANAKRRDFLPLYSRRLNTVEGNTTFYSIPGQDTVERWRDETPPGFKFCLKFPKSISHEKRLHNAEAETAQFLDCLARLGDRCGPAFLQLPPTFGGPNLQSLISYLDLLPPSFPYAVELRHPDFYGGEIETALDEALKARNVARVVFDTRGLRSVTPEDEATRQAQERKPDVPVRFTRTASFAFVRFVGQPEVLANRDLLAEWADHVAGWLRAGDDVFFFAHIPEDRDAPLLAREFHALVNARHPLPPLPEWGEERGVQGRLF
jgi:uncharacterized protein YecE (DUF72 family)